MSKTTSKLTAYLTGALTTLGSFALITYAFNGPPVGCTPDSCSTPLIQDFSTGNVGIGTANPTEKLEVIGNIKANSPTANEHVATKAYVDASGGTNELPRYIIQQTTTTYYGNEVGKRSGANAKCRSQFGDNAVMFGTQHINCYTKGSCILDFRVTNNGWFDNTYNYENYASSNFSYPHNWEDASNCHGWSDGTSSYYGYYITIRGDLNTSACSNRYNIACAYPAT